MASLIISGGMLGTFIGGLLGLCISGCFSNQKSKIAITILFIIIFSFSITLDLYSDKTNFNDGYCVECGTKYDAITHKQGQTYYECPNCHYGVWH